MLARGKIAAAALLAAAALTALAFAACDDGENGGDGDVSAQLAELQEALASAQLVAALTSLDAAGIHDFDETTTQAETVDDVPAGYLADVRKVRAVVQSTGWPDDLHDERGEILAQAEALEAALTGDDLAAMKEASPEFHAAWHELREAGYQALGGEPPEPQHQEEGADAMEDSHAE